jgi:hypothetical protein
VHLPGKGVVPFKVLVQRRLDGRGGLDHVLGGQAAPEGGLEAGENGANPLALLADGLFIDHRDATPLRSA